MNYKLCLTMQFDKIVGKVLFILTTVYIYDMRNVVGLTNIIVIIRVVYNEYDTVKHVYHTCSYQY